MTIQQVQETIKHGGYICMGSDNRPTLYDDAGKIAQAVPMATLERMAKIDGFAKWHEWGAVYVARYLGKRYSDHENKAHCKRIADLLEAYTSGNVYKCPECGEEHYIADCEKYKCSCGFVGELDEYEQQSIGDYLSDCLDIEYRANSEKEYRSAEITVAWGGPNIYIDTAENAVKLYWGSSRAEWYFPNDVANEIDEFCEEMWNCL